MMYYLTEKKTDNINTNTNNSVKNIMLFIPMRRALIAMTELDLISRPVNPDS